MGAGRKGLELMRAEPGWGGWCGPEVGEGGLGSEGSSRACRMTREAPSPSSRLSICGTVTPEALLGTSFSGLSRGQNQDPFPWGLLSG